MAFSGAPKIQSFEIDSTTIVPSVATSDGALAGIFTWGPVGQLTQVSQSKQLVSIFGQPTNLNAETFFTGFNFLSYSQSLWVVRAANTSGLANNIANTTLSAVVTGSNTVSNTVLLGAIVENSDTYATNRTYFDPSVLYVARCPGALGNSLAVSICDSANAYSSTINLIANGNINAVSTAISFVVGSNTATVSVFPSANGTGTDTGIVANNVVNGLIAGDLLTAGNSSVGTQLLKTTSIGPVVQNGANASVTIGLSAKFNLAANFSSNTITRSWQFINSVPKAPTTSSYQAKTVGANNNVIDQLHVVVFDKNGLFTGVPGNVLEIFPAMSRATDAVDSTGATTYYENIINQQSNYVWWGNDRSGAASNTAVNLVSSTNADPLTSSFIGGQDGNSETTIDLGTIANAYNLFADPTVVDVSIILQGHALGGTYGEGLYNYVIGNIVLARQDCVMVASPSQAAVVNASGQQAQNIINFRNAMTSSSYGILDSGYKYQYDQYNNVYRWIPLNGDIGGLIARTDLTNASWWSPAGYNRGIINNVVKLAYNPSATDRDTLFNNDINPVVTQNGVGTVLLGDKTLIGTTSAFNAINVRRLFILLRKSISIAARAFLFEFNDAFTQAQFVNVVDPFLRNIQGGRGITAYNIDSGPDVNTPDVINSDGFVGVVQVIPARAIRYINLYFQAVNNSVTFAEVEGQI